MRNLRRSMPLLFVLLMLLTACPGTTPAPQPVDPCIATCQTYGQQVAAERVQPESEGYIYVAPGDNRVLARVSTIPTGASYPPIDDELFLLARNAEGGANVQKELWRVNYPNADSGGTGLTKTGLYPGRNELQLWYRNTAGPDAHFYAQLGGVAFGGAEGYTTTYREGLTFGNGVIAKLGGNGVVASSKVFVSRVSRPTACACAGLP